MNALATFVSLLLNATAPVTTQPVAADTAPKLPADRAASYQLAWHDEFDSNSLDLAKWVYRTDSKHWSTQLPENVSVSDGLLRLALKKQDARGKQYTGAGVISKEPFKYGYYEARFKCPPGNGWHTSFWMQHHDGSGGTNPKAALQEIDVCEQDSIKPFSYGANVHQWHPKHKAFGPINVKTPDLSADFHTWGCEFSAQKIVFYFEGKVVGERDATQFEHNDQHVWLTSIASHLGKTDAVDDAALPAFAEFDYVRYYRPVDAR